MAQSINLVVSSRTVNAGESICIPLVSAESQILTEVGIWVQQPASQALDSTIRSTTAAGVVATGYALTIHTSEVDSVMEQVAQALEGAIVAGAARRRGLTALLAKISHHCGRIPPSFTLRDIILDSFHVVSGGGYSDVFKGNLHGQNVALKRPRTFSLDEQRGIQEMFCKETVIWRYLNHSNILPFMGVDDSTFAPLLCMVSPWMDHGNMVDYIKKNSLPADLINSLLLEISQGLDYMHEQNVVHGDLRCANILINDDGHAQIADFGLSFAISASQPHATHNGGSIRWTAPELYHGDNPQSSTQTDVYAFGCLCLEGHTQKPPFAEIRPDHVVIASILRGARPKRPSVTQYPSLSIYDRMWTKAEQCWADNPSDRPNVKELVDVLSKLPLSFQDSSTLEDSTPRLHNAIGIPYEQAWRFRIRGRLYKARNRYGEALDQLRSSYDMFMLNGFTTDAQNVMDEVTNF